MTKSILLSFLILSSLIVKAQTHDTIPTGSTSFSNSNIGLRNIYLDVQELRLDKFLKLIEKKAKVKFYFDGVGIAKQPKYTITGGSDSLENILKFVFRSTDISWSYYNTIVVFYSDPNKRVEAFR